MKANVDGDENEMRIREALAAIPKLNSFGIGMFSFNLQLPKAEQKRIFKRNVDGMFVDAKDLPIACDWINENLEQSKRINKKISSYGLKHVMEDITDHYVTNGIFIAAMHCCGFQIETFDGWPNVWFNITQKSLDKSLKMRWMQRATK